MIKMVDWQRIWDDDGKTSGYNPLKIITRFLSLVYLGVVTVRNRLYDHGVFRERKLPCPVISIGNMTVGGTGKTPCVIMLARMLQQNGFKPAVLSRGYGGKNVGDVHIVSNGDNILLGGDVSGDEPLLMAKSLRGVPVLTGAKRILTGRTAIDSFGADVLICDDAMQHRQIFRDLNLVLLDAGVLNARQDLLPGGPWREPIGEIKRATAVLLTRFDHRVGPDGKIMDIIADEKIPVFKSVHKAVALIRADDGIEEPVSGLIGKKICAFCGIANPRSFEKTLQDTGADILSFDVFPDHHPFKAREVEKLKSKFIGKDADYLLTTEKDVMRLQGFPDFLKMICFIRVEMNIVDSADEFNGFILKTLAAGKNQTAAKDIG